MPLFRVSLQPDTPPLHRSSRLELQIKSLEDKQEKKKHEARGADGIRRFVDDPGACRSLQRAGRPRPD